MVLIFIHKCFVFYRFVLVCETADHFSAERVKTRRVEYENGNLIGHYREIGARSETEEARERFYELQSMNSTMVLRVFLDPGLISPDFQIDCLDNVERKRLIGAGLMGCHFIGNIVGHKNSSVVLDVCHGLVSNIFLLICERLYNLLQRTHTTHNERFFVKGPLRRVKIILHSCQRPRTVVRR